MPRKLVSSDWSVPGAFYGFEDTEMGSRNSMNASLRLRFFEKLRSSLYEVTFLLFLQVKKQEVTEFGSFNTGVCPKAGLVELQ